MIFLVQFGINKHTWIFQRSQIALTLPGLAILLVFEKFTRAYLFQIALEIMWLPILNTRGFRVLKENFIFDHCKSYDIFQESRISDPNLYLSLSRRWSGRFFWSPAIGRQGGVITFSSERSNSEVISWCKNRPFSLVHFVFPIQITW